MVQYNEIPVQKTYLQWAEEIDNAEVKEAFIRNVIKLGWQNMTSAKLQWCFNFPDFDAEGNEIDYYSDYWSKIMCLVVLFGNVGDGNIDLQRPSTGAPVHHEEDKITQPMDTIIDVIHSPFLKEATFEVGSAKIVISRINEPEAERSVATAAQ